jgi:hypothetical protein
VARFQESPQDNFSCYGPLRLRRLIYLLRWSFWREQGHGLCRAGGKCREPPEAMDQQKRKNKALYTYIVRTIDRFETTLTTVRGCFGSLAGSAQSRVLQMTRGAFGLPPERTCISGKRRTCTRGDGIPFLS